jgi:hypothetical protein
MSILNSLIESGGVTESEILISLHKSGAVDVLKLLAETARTKISAIGEVSTKADVRAIKAELIDILDTIEAMIEDEEAPEDNGEYVIPVSSPEVL